MEVLFTLFGTDFSFTRLGDHVSMYHFGCRYYEDGVLVEDTTVGQYWHRVGFGFYRRSDSWLK